MTTCAAHPPKHLGSFDVILGQVLPYSLTRQTQKLGLEGAAQLRRCARGSVLGLHNFTVQAAHT